MLRWTINPINRRHYADHLLSVQLAACVFEGELSQFALADVAVAASAAAGTEIQQSWPTNQ